MPTSPSQAIPEPDLPHADLASRLAAAQAEVGNLKAQLDELREQDPLTGLPNRLRLVDRTGQAIRLAQRQGAMVAMVVIDLDRFNAITHSLSFAEGDDLILQIVRRMTDLLGSLDTLARIGTDQFAVLLPEVRDASEPMRIAQGLLEAVALPYRIGPREVRLTASLGISLSPQDGDDANSLQHEARNAVNRAKASGGHAIQCSTLTLSEASFERQQLETFLGEAIRQSQLEVHYQPQVMDGLIIGVEALLRWQHPVLGLVPPTKFIPLAEENRLIHTLGEWTLATACRQAALWQAMSTRSVKLAVNVSPLQLSDPRWLAFVARTLEESRLSPGCLELEITEGTLLKNVRPGPTPLHDLKALGVCIGIDDFGTGYSNLTYLQRFPIDTLKVDQAFVAGLFPHQAGVLSSRPIVKTIVDLGNNLGMTVLAEGVETVAQQEALKTMGCKVHQGFLTGRPMEAAALTRLLELQIARTF